MTSIDEISSCLSWKKKLNTNIETMKQISTTDSLTVIIFLTEFSRNEGLYLCRTSFIWRLQGFTWMYR